MRHDELGTGDSDEAGAQRTRAEMRPDVRRARSRWWERRLALYKVCPVGQISKILSSPLAKNISLNPSGKSALPARPVLSRQEGRSRVVTNAGGMRWTQQRRRETVSQGESLVSDQPARRTNGAKARRSLSWRRRVAAYGKTVWSRYPLLAP